MKEKRLFSKVVSLALAAVMMFSVLTVVTPEEVSAADTTIDRKSTRLNSSHRT